MKILIFIVSYNADKRVLDVLRRIPGDVLSFEDLDILVLDDASTDDTALIAGTWNRCKGSFTVLKNLINQGYGGNQKLGYQYAIDQGYDLVILLHGDGQYAPEYLGAFIQEFNINRPDVILGSRMLSRKSALQGGMPKYKYVGNRILTCFQNWMTGMHLSEYHTGYRAYSVKFLTSIPFQSNTNDFHFDTQILLQASARSAVIKELPIPTYYGNEKCHVNGLKYAVEVFKATFQYKMHTMGIFCSLLYRNLDPVTYKDKTSLPYTSHAEAIKLLRKFNPRTVLDLGCGPGFVAEQCKAMGAEVSGIDIESPLPDKVDHFTQADLNKGVGELSIFDYDAVLLLDIIEHLHEPEQFLISLRNKLPNNPSGRSPIFLISTPNVAFITIRLNLLLGRFNYAERGILDITHCRLFTRKSLLTMLKNCGYMVDQKVSLGVPARAVIGGPAGRFLEAISALLAKLVPTLFAFQFLLVCRPKPGVQQLLRQVVVVRKT